MHLVEGDKLVLESKALFTAVTPLLLLILGNILTMSEDKIMALSGIPLAFNNSEMSVRWYESFCIFCRYYLFVFFVQCFSTNIARFSMAVLHPVVRSLIGIFGLCIL